MSDPVLHPFPFNQLCFLQGVFGRKVGLQNPLCIAFNRYLKKNYAVTGTNKGLLLAWWGRKVFKSVEVSVKLCRNKFEQFL